MSSSQITIDLQNKRHRGENITSVDVINAITKCVNESIPIGFWIVNLVVLKTVPFDKEQIKVLITLVKDGQLHWARRFAWNECRAYIRMLDTLEQEK